MAYYNYRYKQKDYAKIILKNGFQTKFYSFELKLLAEYFKEKLGAGIDERKALLIKFCKKFFPNFSMYKHFKLVNDAFNYTLVKKHFLVQINRVEIFKKEFLYINSLKIKKVHKKILFTFLVLQKLKKIMFELKSGEKYYGLTFQGQTSDFNRIKEVANINYVHKINQGIIFSLYQKNLIIPKYSGIIVLDFIKNCQEKGGIIKPCVTDFDNIGYYFEIYQGNADITICQKCSKPFKKKSNRQIYCDADCMAGV